MRRETMRRVYEYLILWWEGVGEVGRAVPEVLVMSGAVKIFTLNTALWDMSRREGVGKKEEEEEEGCDVLPSFLSSIFPPPSVVTSLFPASRQIKWVSITHQYNTLEGRKRRI